MATVTYTPNLSLKISSDDDAITKYNLNRIDYLAQKINIAVSGNTVVSSSTNVDIYAAYGLGVNRYNGIITLDAGNLGTFDTSSEVRINAKKFTVNTNGGEVSFNAASVDFNGASPTALGLAEGKLLIGDASGEAQPQTMSGDATIDASGSLVIAPQAVGTGKLSDSSVTTDKLSDEAVTNDKVSASAGIAYSKLNLSVSIVDSDVAPNAAIDQSKINNLMSDLAAKEPTVTKGDFTASPPNVLSVNGGTGAVIGGGVSVTIPRATNYESGYIHYSDFSRFNNYAPSTTSDIVSSTDGVTITGAVDIVPSATDVTIDIATATGSQQGLLSASDWTLFNSKESGGAAAAALASHTSTYNHANYDSHIISTSNPHSVTKDQVGLSNVTNDAQLPIAGGTMTGQLGLDKQGVVFNITDDFVGTPAEGTVWWNKDDHTLNIQSDIVGTINQVGQENWLRARNDTGAPIPEGAVVYINGANTARPTVALAVASSPVADKVIGVATVEIADGQLGVITTFGLVRHINTNVDGDGVALADGDPLYLSATTAGEWVKAKPHAPNHCIRVGQVVNAGSGGSGNIFVNTTTGTHLQDLHDVNIETGLTTGQTIRYNGSIFTNYTPDHADLLNKGTNTHAQIDSHITNETLIKTTTGEITGFEDPANIDISYDSTARTVTLTHGSGTIAYWIRGTRHTRSSPYTPVAHNSTLNLVYFGYFDANNNWAWANSLPDIFSSAGNVYVVSCRYFSAYKFGIRECHGLMQWQAWYNLHNSQGTVHLSGGLVTAATYALNTNTIAAVTPDMDSAVILDEDLPTTVPALTGGTYMRMYLDTNVVTFSSGSTPYLTTGIPSTGSPQYNQNPVSGTALTTITTNNRWFNVYGIEVPVTADTESQGYRWLWLTGQQLYTSLASAQAEDFRTLQLGNFTAVAQEFVPRVRWTFIRTGSNLTYNTQINAEPSYLVGGKIANTAITITASNTPASRYSTSLSWTGVGPYTMSIAGATHGRGTDPIIRIRELTSGTSYDVVDIDNITIDSSTGDVVLYSTSNFTGTVVIL